MSSSQLLVLPANSSAKVFPDNTNHTFKTKLSKRLCLEGEKWSIGLKSYTFPFNWHNITDKRNRIKLTLYNGEAVKGQGEEKILRVTPARYRSPKQLCKEINKQIRQEGAKDRIRLDFDEDARIISIYWSDGDDSSIEFDTDVAALLGCKPNFTYAKKRPVTECEFYNFDRSPDMNAGFHNLYIYCSLCDVRPIGDTEAPLLLDIPVPNIENYNAAQVFKRLSDLEFVKVQNTNTDVVEVNIRGGDGEPIAFKGGLVSITVELRKS